MNEIVKNITFWRMQIIRAKVELQKYSAFKLRAVHKTWLHYNTLD